ncbi:CCA tRNA nucleotidyltransferase [Actinomyces minihominis]|uniref:CCA tRNA nucleotidyltransferase n=1 Tax=Actinomyces minihominis TaxID=2002838 RepID=UPI001F5CF0D9|nr:CCA tRNA nucleotidyltransferase [Actinomyces minihominis]
MGQLEQQMTSLVGGGDVPALLSSGLTTLSNLPRQILRLSEVFTQRGHEIALVGGPVRDAFLGVEAKDIDLTTSATPDETEAIMREWADTVWTVGREFGTIAGRKGDLEVEVTTYRTEEYEENSRKPVVVYGKTLEGDLSRRDFTVNAMAMRLPELALVDPFGGLEDLAEGVLRTPVSATQSFRDDPLRIMRAARFTAQLGADVDEDVMRAMGNEAKRLEIVSAERIRSELERLMISPHPRRGLELLVYTGAVDYVLPELAQLQDTVDEHGRHKDVYEHTLTVLDQAIALETGPEGPVPGPDFILRFAALMHDIGKPATRRFEGKKVTFHQHDVVGAKITRRRMKALRFDKATTNAVSDLVSGHLRFHGYGEQQWSDAAVRRYVTDAGDQLERLHRLTRADVTTGNRRKAAFISAAYDDLERRIAELREKEQLDSIRPDLDGEQIMELLNIGPSREVGEAYRFLMAIRMEEGSIDPEEAKKRLLRWWDTRN